GRPPNILFTAHSPRIKLAHSGQKRIYEYRRLQMDIDTYLRLKKQVLERGYQSDIDWCETVGPPETADVFVSEYVWVVLNSGMKAEVARRIWERVWAAVRRGDLVSTVFRHPGKARDIQDA